MKRSEFDWLAEDDDHLFNDRAHSSGRHNHFWERISFWLALLAAVLLLSSYFILDRKQSLLQDEKQQDIVAGFELWYEAVLNDDLELFNLTLSKEDGYWQLTQKKLLTRGLILDRTSFGLQMQSGRHSEPELDFSPDLHRAILSFEQEYVIDRPENLGRVRLKHTALYINQDSRWLYSPMDDAYWGDWQQEEGEFLTVEYKGRDAGIVQRIARDLNGQMRKKCQDVESEEFSCRSLEPFTLIMSPDFSTIESFSHVAASLLQGKTILLPTPSLVGLPIDAAGYEVIYEGYASIVLEHYESYFTLPISLPQEAIYSLCFDFPNAGFRLFRYDPGKDTWTAELPDRAFYSLRALPDDKGVVLQESADFDAGNRLRLVQYQDGQDSVLIDETFEGSSFRPIGWAASDFSPRLLLQRNNYGQPLVDYGWLDLQSCAGNNCDFLEVNGFPTWSTDGKHTLLIQGSTITLGDSQGQTSAVIGPGFNPFWLGHETYGFIRFNEIAAGVITEIVVGRLSDQEQIVLLDSNSLSRFVGIEKGDNIFIQYVTTSPVDPNLLILSASGVGNLAGEFFVFSYRIAEDLPMEGSGEIKLLLRHKGTPGGTPASLTPTGFPPIEVSPDGRWLLLSELASESKNTWSFIFLALNQNLTQRTTESFPVLPAQFPFYDWSKDGQWLVIADHGFFRLVAPDYEYERLIPHEFDSCGYTVWSE